MKFVSIVLSGTAIASVGAIHVMSGRCPTFRAQQQREEAFQAALKELPAQVKELTERVKALEDKDAQSDGAASQQQREQERAKDVQALLLYESVKI